MLKKPKRISEMASVWAGGVKNMTYTFNLREEISSELRNNVTKDKVLAFFDSTIAQTGANRRLFCVHYQGKSAREEAGEGVFAESTEKVIDIDDALKWQSSQDLYPAEKATAHQSKL